MAKTKTIDRRTQPRAQNGRWQSSLTDIEPNKILVRGYPLDEMMGRLGFAEDPGTFTLGVTTLAVPVFAPDESLRGVIGIGAISAQLEDKLKIKLIRSLKRAAGEIGAKL